ncbi:capZ-interacting protein, partial [Notothenia coriiceps]|uniref:CapZ-interacting protein n=1 Tax=Notothenia coriiceps TaxID=8208 RepID=A0A6I9N8F9_9TELE
ICLTGFLQKAVISSNPFNVKTKNSSIIEKLQANLALSPTALLPSPKSPEVRLQPTPLSPVVPYSPLTSHLSSEEEDPISFDSPPEGIPLPNFNKTRARLSFKRRPPTRQHRRSTGEEIGAIGGVQSPCELYGPKVNGDHVVEHGQPASLNEAEEKDKDCEQTEDEVARSDPDYMGHPEEEQEAEQTQNVEVMEEEEQPSEPSTSMQIEGDVETEEMEEMPQEEH